MRNLAPGTTSGEAGGGPALTSAPATRLQSVSVPQEAGGEYVI
jgi:hypothetical protein